MMKLRIHLRPDVLLEDFDLFTSTIEHRITPQGLFPMQKFRGDLRERANAQA
ncbi:MAG: hypothetical protein U0941_12245 [Planctomycetaceae bacterium]